MSLSKDEKKTGFGSFLDMIKGILRRSPTADEIDRAAVSYVGHSPLVAACEKITKERKEAVEPPGALYSAADIEAAKKQAGNDARSEFKKEIAAKFAEEKIKSRKAEIVDFCESGVNSGVIPKNWIDNGLMQFMECLSGDDSAIAFSEYSEKITTLQWFKNWIIDVRKIMPVSDINIESNSK